MTEFAVACSAAIDTAGDALSIEDKQDADECKNGEERKRGEQFDERGASAILSMSYHGHTPAASIVNDVLSRLERGVNCTVADTCRCRMDCAAGGETASTHENCNRGADS